MLLSRITTLPAVIFIIKPFLFLFQKRFLLKMYLLFLDIITIRLHILNAIS